MSDLQDLIQDFDLITGIAYELSQQFDGLQTTDRKRKVSTHYLAKIVPECMSLLRLLPGSRYTDSKELFDFPSFCSISRNLIEAANLHWYYCIDNTSDEQSEFRFDLYDYHDYRARLRLGELLAADHKELDMLRSESNQLKERIRKHTLFAGLLPEVQRQILKGRKCSELNQTEIVQKRGIETDTFSGVYKVLSNNTHSTPSAISSVVHSRINGQGLQSALSCVVLSYVASFVAHLVKSIGKLWDVQFGRRESKVFIDDYSSKLNVGN